MKGAGMRRKGELLRLSEGQRFDSFHKTYDEMRTPKICSCYCFQTYLSLNALIRLAEQNV
jgi:hypothetical protein